LFVLYSRVAANDWGSSGEALDSRREDSRAYGESDPGISSWDRGASGSEEDDEDDSGSEPYDPPPISTDGGEFLGGEGNTASAETFATVIHCAAAPEASNNYVPPRSLYVKRLAPLF
jgi:hypothetical protein